jgi:predicted transcriptional regulator
MINVAHCQEGKMKRATINVQLTPDIRAILDELATQQSSEAQQVFPADVIRQALEEFLNRKGYEVAVRVNRGGYRRRKENS